MLEIRLSSTTTSLPPDRLPALTPAAHELEAAAQAAEALDGALLPHLGLVDGSAAAQAGVGGSDHGPSVVRVLEARRAGPAFAIIVGGEDADVPSREAADGGAHRICAYYMNENAEIPCRIADLPS